jgi:hypothetical protein
MTHLVLFLGRLTECFLAINLLIQTIEYLHLREATGPQGVWAFSLQGRDFKSAPMLHALFGWLSQEAIYFWLLLLRLMACLVLFVAGGSLPLILFLFVSGLFIVMRWRGAFNGGSDFMTMAVMTGCVLASVIGYWESEELGWRAGLIYIAIQSATSYFISGGVKLLSAEWRNGQALPLFLDGGVYGPLSRLSPYWFGAVAKTVSWAFILWECSIPLALLALPNALFFCTVGLFFHGLVFWYFGLNRFVFAWLSSYPALCFIASVIGG